MNQDSNVSAAHDMSPGLLRQRRNLLAVALVLIFLEVSKAKIHTFQLMGIHVTFEQPEALFWLLFCSVLYLTYRYHLYLIQEPNWVLRKRFFELLNSYSNDYLSKKMDESFGADRKVALQEQLGARRLEGNEWVIMVSDPHNPYGAGETEYLRVPIIEIWWEVLKACVVASISRSYFTDYIAPYILSLMATVLCVLKLLEF